LHSILVSGTEIRLPMPPPGVYLWWAEPVTLSRGWFTNKLKSIGKAVLKVAEQITPLVSYITDKNVSLSESAIRPFFTATPMGTFNVIAGGVDVLKKTLGLTPIRARKDTKMLDLGWGKQGEASIDKEWWDRPNKDTTLNDTLRDDEENRCWAITVQQLNRYFGGTLTQDEIVYYGKSHNRSIEDHFPHEGVDASGFPSIIPTMAYALNTSTGFQGVLDVTTIFEMAGLLASEPGWFVRPPNPYTVIASIESGIPVAVAQVNQGYTAMHMLVIDGYRIQIDGSIYLHFVGKTNRGRLDDDAEWRYYASILGTGVDVIANLTTQIINNLADLAFEWSLGANFYVAYYIPPDDVTGRKANPFIVSEIDTDEDGILDFDEITRFGTNPNKTDTDGDGIPDKMEIAYYTRKGVSADIDGDGLRAELDVDSDGDEDCDGDENANLNDRKDGKETDMMDSKNFTQQNCKAKPIALMALEQININDRAYCTDGSNHCPIVSLGHGDGHAVQLGVYAEVGSILAGSSVWLRSHASVFGNIHSVGPLISQDATPRVSGTATENDTNAFYMLLQIYRPLLYYSDKEMIFSAMQIHSGQTITLQPDTYEQNIVVSSGSVLRLQPGNYKIGGLKVQSGGKLELIGGDSISLDISGPFQWDGTLLNSIQEAASRLRIQVLGFPDIFLNTSFGGFIVAPNAHVVVGQADKDYAGQIYAKRITLHQNTRFQWIQPGSQQSPGSKRSMSIAALNRGNIHVCSNN